MAHPLAVLPLKKTPYLMPGMVVGSMVPDFPHFLPFFWSYSTAHSLRGVFTVDVLAGLVILALWQYLLRPAYEEQVPSGLRRWTPSPRPTVRWWLLALPSVLLGVLTHLMWDMFTHKWSPVWVMFPFLQVQAGPFSLLLWLQYLSSVIGVAALGVILRRKWLRAKPVRALVQPDPGEQAFMWGVPAIGAFIATSADLLALLLAGENTIRPYVQSLVTTSVAVYGVVALILSGLWHLRRRLGLFPRRSA